MSPFPFSAWALCSDPFIFSGGGGSVTNGQDGAGPQVPPRLGGDKPGQDRVLSVSGKKKCSHCKEELGELWRNQDLDNLLLGCSK